MNRLDGTSQTKERKQMKKLMIAAALTAMTGAAFAIDAQVYDASFSIKTTACKEAKVSKALAAYFGNGNNVALPDADADDQFAYEQGDVIGLRKQATRKMVGVIWGCDCITIANPSWRKYANGKYVGGYAFWDPSSGEHFYIPGTRMVWSLLNRIDAMNKAEGMWSIANNINGQAFFYTGAGFGTIAGKDCSAYIKSISGNFAGFRQSIGDEFGCIFCDANDCYVEPFCNGVNGNLLAWPTCDTCGNFANAKALTAAYGTWNIKYNKSMSKKLGSTARLSRIYKFGKATGLQAVIAAIETLVANGTLDEEADHSQEIDLADLEAAYAELDEDFEAPDPVDEETLGNAKALALIDAVLEAEADEPEHEEE